MEVLMFILYIVQCSWLYECILGMEGIIQKMYVQMQAYICYSINPLERLSLNNKCDYIFRRFVRLEMS